MTGLTESAQQKVRAGCIEGGQVKFPLLRPWFFQSVYLITSLSAISAPDLMVRLPWMVVIPAALVNPLS